MAKRRRSVHYDVKYDEQLKAEANFKYEGNFSLLVRKIIEEHCEKQKRPNHSHIIV